MIRTLRLASFASSAALTTFVTVSLVACAGAGTPDAKTPAPAAPAAAATKDPSLKLPGEAKPGDKTTCPVSGEEFVVEATSPKVEHDGKTYYFCCSGCDKKFQANPAKYVAPKT